MKPGNQNSFNSLKEININGKNYSIYSLKEAEKNDIKDYPLYHWTKSVVQDPDKQIKHSKSFAFYFGDEQIYEKELAVSLYNDLVEFNDENKIEEIKMIDSNPRNNPQPPRIKTNL